MKPVVHPLVHSMIDTALSFFVLMVRKQQVHTATMNVNIRSQNVAKNVTVTLVPGKRNLFKEVLCPCYTLTMHVANQLQLDRKLSALSITRLIYCTFFCYFMLPHQMPKIVVIQAKTVTGKYATVYSL
jgi:hypothetical protein